MVLPVMGPEEAFGARGESIRESGVLLQNAADMAKLASLPSSVSSGVKELACLPGILQGNSLTSNGLSHFFLSPCEKQRVFLSIPLPLPIL